MGSSYIRLRITTAEIFRSSRKFLDDGATSMQHLTKQILTTKLTKAAKNSDIVCYKFRVLRAVVVKHVFFFLVAAPRLKGHMATSETG